MTHDPNEEPNVYPHQPVYVVVLPGVVDGLRRVTTNHADAWSYAQGIGAVIAQLPVVADFRRMVESATPGELPPGVG